jgi:hypothetical protein
MGSKANYLGLAVLSAGMVLAATSTLASAQVMTTMGEGHVRMHMGERFGLEDGKVVKGVPFSAQATIEHTQTLNDGNHIHVTHTASLFRDSEGRVRREMNITGMAPLAASTSSPKMIMINDAVAGVRYMLNPDTKVAHKMPSRHEMGMTKTLPNGAVIYQKTPNGDVMYRRVPGAPGAASVAGPGGKGQETSESLGDQVIQGIKVQGTRTTTTIPAGQMGNERPIQIVSERWYSPELQTVVKFTHSDPWAGETTYQLTNISRAEPDSALFQVPADYSVKEGPAMFEFHHGGPPLPPPAPPDSPDE